MACNSKDPLSEIIFQPERLEEAIITGKELTDEEVRYLEEPYVPPPLHLDLM